MRSNSNRRARERNACVWIRRVKATADLAREGDAWKPQNLSMMFSSQQCRPVTLHAPCVRRFPTVPPWYCCSVGCLHLHLFYRIEGSRNWGYKQKQRSNNSGTMQIHWNIFRWSSSLTRLQAQTTTQIIDAWGSVRGLWEMAKVAIEVLLVGNPIARIRAGNWGHGGRCKNQQLKYVWRTGSCLRCL